MVSQGLAVLDPTSQAFDRCLFELRRVCGTCKILPASHIISCALLDVSNNGAFANIHEGVLGNVKVCVKKVRISEDGPDKLEVRFPSRSLPGLQIPNAPHSCSTTRLLCGSTLITQTSFDFVELPSTLLSSFRIGRNMGVYSNF